MLAGGRFSGSLPPQVRRYVVESGATVVQTCDPRPPQPHEVVVEVAGSAVGAAPGAEVAGRVVAAGEAAGEWLGRRVVVPRVLPCGECDACRRGRTARCRLATPREAVATHATVPARFLLSVEPPLWSEHEPLAALAALADAVATPYGALVRAQLAPGDLCVIVGGGVRGRFAAAIAQARGAYAAVIESDPALAELARQAGARFVVDGGGGLDARHLRAALVADAVAAGVSVVEPKVIDTTGTAAGRRRALELVSDGGVLALLADGDGLAVPAPLEELAHHECTVVGAAACHPDLYVELMALVVRGDLRLSPEVTLLPFEALASAILDVRTGRERRLPILVPHDSSPRQGSPERPSAS